LGRAKNGERAKSWKEGDGGEERKGALAHKPIDFEKCPPVFTVEFIY